MMHHGFLFGFCTSSLLLPSLASTTTTTIIRDGCSCENGGTCRVDSPFCACPVGWTGATCDEVYESCQGKCQNGGKCWNGELDDFGNVQNYCACDRFHTGKYCQHTVVPTDVGCTNANQAQFCLHGGACNPGYYANSKIAPCLCPSGYTGDRCEEEVEIRVPDTETTSDALLIPDNGGFDSTSSSSSSASCSLDCQRGTCQFGKMMTHPDGWEAPSETMHCVCEAGYGGPYCEFKAADCGSHKCYNGATCEKDLETNLLHCDCSTATSDQVYYAGQFCQYASTEYCMFHPEVGDLFCVNHGTCRPQAYEGCNCPQGYEGFSCEFKIGSSITTSTTGNAVDYSFCTLACLNGGECRKGEQYTKNNDPNDEEHCVCPTQFTGDLCEKKASSSSTGTTTATTSTQQQEKGTTLSESVDCGEGRHTCDRSAKCVAYGDEQLCDCGTGRLATFFEGQNCVHPTHDICTIGVAASDATTYRQIVPTQQLSYCVNGGRCKRAVNPNEPHAGCNCVDGFLGPHCELMESSPVPRVTYKQDDSDEGFNVNTANRNIFRVGIAVVMVLVMSVFVAMLIHTARRRRKQRFSTEVSSSLFWSSGYSDELRNNNIAPKRSSSIFSENPHDVYTDAVVQTSRRDMAIEMNRSRKAASIASDDDNTTTSNNNNNDRPDDVPNLYIGPPRDEDGHELHNVEIV